MAHLIDKSALVAEIERICAEEKALFDEQCRGGFEPSPSPAVVCMKMECLLSFINTLEVKEVDYERELSKYGMKVQKEQMLLNMATTKRKDLELAWEDMEKVFDLCYEVLRDVYLMKFPDDKEEQQDFYEEVLKRFKDLKK